MRKILFVSHSSHWGGGEKCLYLLLKGLSREEFEPVLVLPEDHALKAAVEDLGIRTRPCSLLPWVRPWADFARCPSFREGVDQITGLIEEEQPDLVVSNTSVMVGGALAALRCGVPHVWHVLEMLSQDPTSKPSLDFHSFFLLLTKLSNRVVAASASVKADICQFVDGSNIDVIHTGIELSDDRQPERSKQKVFGVSEDTFVVSFAGDLGERKGAEDLIRSARQVLARNPNARFMLAGRDAERGQAVRELLAELAMGDAVQLLGFRSDVEDIMAASDVFVLPTLADPLPLVVQEAMSVATPVIATRSGGCEDMVVDGETGYLVPVSDPAALAAAITTVMENPDERQRMGQNGRQRLETHFSHRGYVDSMSRLFHEVSQEPSPDSMTLSAVQMSQFLIPCLDAMIARQGLEYRNAELQELHDAMEQSVSTRLGRLLTSPWRGLRGLLGR